MTTERRGKKHLSYHTSGAFHWYIQRRDGKVLHVAFSGTGVKGYGWTGAIADCLNSGDKWVESNSPFAASFKTRARAQRVRQELFSLSNIKFDGIRLIRLQDED